MPFHYHPFSAAAVKRLLEPTGLSCLLNQPEVQLESEEIPVSREAHDEKTKERDSIRLFYNYGVCMQLALFGLTYLASPSYVTPFLNHPVARVFLAAIFAWEAFGIVLHWWLAPASPWKRVTCYTFTILFCGIPVLLTPMLGPAVVTIMNSCGACRLGG